MSRTRTEGEDFLRRAESAGFTEDQARFMLDYCYALDKVFEDEYD